MTFGHAVTTCMNKYAIFTGRASRSEYWWFFLFSQLVDLSAIIYEVTLPNSQFADGFGPVSPVSIALTLVFLLPALAVGARRLHDIGKSGWWQLLSVPSYIHFFIIDPLSELSETIVDISLMTASAGVIPLLILFAFPTNPEKNKYDQEEATASPNST